MGLFDSLNFTVVDVGDTLKHAADQVGEAFAPAGFTLERDEATTMVTRLKGIRGQLKDMRNDAITLCQIQPPSTDTATMGYQQVLTRNQAGQPGALDYGGGQIDTQTAYLDELIGRLEDALGMVRDTEADQKSKLQQAGKTTEGRV